MAENLQKSKYQFIEPDEQKEFEAYFKQNGLENIVDFVSRKISGVENVSVKIAVTGKAGVGKSTFINTFRGLTLEDDGAASVSAHESGATMVPEEYHHPRNRNITLWDLPGIGTSIFNEENYEKKVNFDSYDFFLIFIGNRIFKHDEWLAKRAKIRNKKYFIVRTRIDDDIESDKQNRPRTHNAPRLLAEIRDKNKMLLEGKGIYPEGGIYLISALLRYVNEWDYRKLEHDMLHVLPREKREVLTLSLNNISEDLIKAKCEILRRRVWKKSIFLAAEGFVPSGLSGVMPQEVIDFINEEMTSYREVLGLDEESLRRFSQRTGIDLESLISMTTERIEPPLDRLNLGALMSALIAQRTATFTEPVVALLATFSAVYCESYKSANELLHEILDRLESASLQVLKATLSSTPQ